MPPFGSWEMGERIAHGPPLGQEVQLYLDKQPPEYQQGLRDATVASWQHATPAFRANWEAPMVIAIPVDAEREAAYVRNTLQQYANQVDAPPYRVLLYANYQPGDEDYFPVRDTLAAIERFQEEHPHVPVAYFDGPRPEDATIGGLRKLVSDVAILPFVASQSAEDALLINHDIDTHRLHPLYLRRMWEAFTQPDRLTTAIHSEVRHARSYDKWGRQRLPNMDMVNAWEDFNVLARGVYFDLGNGVSVRGYCAADGYNPAKLQAETFDLIERIHRGATIYHPGIYGVPGSYLYTSPRRLYHQQFANAGEVKVFWDPGDMTSWFADYRDGPVFTLPDISPILRDNYIRFIAHGMPARIAAHVRYVHPELTLMQAMERARRIMRLGHLLIGGPEDILVARTTRMGSKGEQG